MKITAGMVEAGANALAKNRKQADKAVVAAVFSAMMGRARVEQAIGPKDIEPPKVMSYWPSWRFGPNGERQLFKSEAEVPEGWVDSPKKVGDWLKPGEIVTTSESPDTYVVAGETTVRRGRPPKVPR